MKKIVVLLMVMCMVFAFAACGNSENEATSYSFSINCEKIAENMDAIENGAITDLIPENGMLMEEAAIAGDLKEGATIMDATIKTCQVMGISYDYSQGYISMLADVSAGDCGGWSGWLVKVNGEFPEVGADELVINDGDTIEWIYSLDGGADIGAW